MKKIIFPFCSTLLIYAVCYGICYFGLQVTLSPRLLWRDLLFLGSISTLLFQISRWKTLFYVFQTLLIFLLFVCSSMKISFFGTPIVPDDLFAAKAMILILQGAEKWAALTVLLGVILSFVLNLQLRTKLQKSCLMFLVCGMAALYFWPQAPLRWMDTHWGNTVWSQRLNFIQRGPGIFMLQESLRFWRDNQILTSKAEINQITQALATNQTHFEFEPITPANERKARRNLHVILLESFWDAQKLKQVHFNRDPFSDAFRALWNDAGNSTIFPPVFGGYTANSEFELLCGFPVTEDAVKFERRLQNQVPCLPQVLQQQGYHTIASHPNIAGFWNRVNVYPRIGFQTRWFLPDYQAEDMLQNEFMGDSTYYRQTLDKIAQWRKDPAQQEQPLFNYMVSIFGHLPYPLNERRPPVISAVSAVSVDEVDPVLIAYANNVYYKTMELMQTVAEIQMADPDAVIVMFGDHLPNLGLNFNGFRQAGLMLERKDQFSAEMLRNLHETPLIVINGKHGVVRGLGAVPLYRLADYLLYLLEIPANPLISFARPPDIQQRIRPLPGMYFTVDSQGTALLVREQPGKPQHFLRWIEQLEILGLDIFQGKQYGLPPK